MILVDASVLLHAYEPRSAHHETCRGWVERAFSGEQPVCLAWVTILAFLRIITNPAVFGAPLSVAEATDVVASWLAQPAVFVLEAGERRWELLRALLVEGGIEGEQVTHAFLAALALENGATLVRPTATSPASKGYSSAIRRRPERPERPRRTARRAPGLS